MAILDKLKFWKKEKETPLDFTTDPFAASQQTGLNLNPSDPTGLGLGQMPGTSGYGQTPEEEFPSFGMQPPSSERERSSFESSPSARAVSVEHEKPVDLVPLQKEIEMLSIKLDTVKLMLEHLNHRLENIERLARQSEEQALPVRRRGSW